MRLRLAMFALLLLTAAPAARRATAQSTAGYYPASKNAAPSSVRQASYQSVTGRSNPALEFFGGSKALAYAPQNQTRQTAPVPVQTAPMGKPFAGNQQQQGSNVSPYLALDYLESPNGLPNYYMFVRPQLDQQQVNQTSRAQYRRMQTQFRKAVAGGAVSNPNGGIPTTGHSSQFMNSGGYYPAPR